MVVSLIYVGIQIRQNTAAIQTSTSHAVYQLHQEQQLLVLENSDVAAVVLKANRAPDTMTPVDSLRYNRYLNIRLNLREAVYEYTIQGTRGKEVAAGWLAGLRDLPCTPGMARYWADRKSGYHPKFRNAVDSAFAVANCRE